ncbi:hypothetical protein DMP07_04330 [Slackia faecicanis]|uniref:Head decoration protein n=1 Tax=Slackia faecicanis TaxID=255723 RepID=A0A3N0AGF4_9ACTN|nr:hypothetical protein [Slackia faecicanis]RNL20811.1 hypothetical protein DMP07_04330 [Slackia faecicanis]
MAFNKTEKYGSSENVLESEVGLVVKTRQATQEIADSGTKVLKAGTLFKDDTYAKQSDTVSKHPNTEGWFEIVDGEFVKSADKDPVPGKDYYKQTKAAAPVGVVLEDYDMKDYGAYPVAVVVQGRVKASKVSAEAAKAKDTLAKQGLYLV